MAETESHDYWCYHCDKSVAVETLPDLPDDVVCFDCKNGFVESISVPDVDHRLLNMLRLIARPENAPPPSSPSYEDFLGLTWISDDDEEADRSVTAGHEEEEDDDDDNGEEHSENNGSDVDNGEEYNGSDDDNGEEYSDDDNGEEHSETESEFEEEEEEENEVIEYDDDQMRVRSISEVLRQRLREIDDEEDRLRARSISEVLRHRLRGALDWPEVVMDLEQLSDRIRLHVLESEYYVGNPGDYVDAAGYEALLQNLAETDNGGRRGAPPASKAAVEGLETVVIGSESKTTTCAVCRDLVNVGQVVKKLPCGHEYHSDCILPWLDSRNSCPVCRFELPTDDPEYEEERRSRRVDAAASSAIPSGDSGLE